MNSKISLINQHLQTMKLMSDLRGVGSYPDNVLDNSIWLLNTLDDELLSEVSFDYNKQRGCMLMHYQHNVTISIFGTHYMYETKKYNDVVELLKAIPFIHKTHFI